MCRFRGVAPCLLALLLAGIASTAQAAWHANGNAAARYPYTQQGPELAPDGNGGAFIVWSDIRNNLTTDIDIYAQHLLADGGLAPGWPGEGLPICNAIHGQYHFAIASDGAGGAVIVWDDARTSSATDIYAQRVTDAGARLWGVNGVALSTAAGEQMYPRIIGDGSGGAIAVWYGGTGNDVHAQHVLANGTVDAAWPVNGLPVAATTNAQYEPRIIADGAGAWIVSFGDSRGSTLDIYAQRLLLGGTVDPTWPVNGRALVVGSGDQFDSGLVSDGAGGAVVTWTDSRAGFDVYAQHVLASGAVDPAWTVNGVPLCGHPTFQTGARIASDGAGGAIVTWMDTRAGGSAYDIYANRVRANGTLDPAWPVNGRALCTLKSGSNPQIVAGSSGDAIVAWHDVRNPSDVDLYAQHVLATGVVDPAWASPDGLPVCTAVYGAINVQLVPNGVGGAVLAWADSRESSFENIYVQWLPASGALADVGPRDRAPAFALHTAPNPAPNGRVALRFVLPSARPVHAEVYDLAGHRVRTLARGADLGAGEHTLKWDADDDLGARVASGIYLVRVRAGGNVTAHKVAVLQ